MSRSKKVKRTPHPFATLLCALLTCIAQADDWRAQWIGLPETVPNSWLCFRASLETPQDVGKVIARIACDSKYWLWVNGRLVVFEGQLKRGPTPHDTYFERVDLTEHLHPGENLLAALVWYFGKDGMSHVDSGKAGFLFEADLGDTVWVSDKRWRARVHPAFGPTNQPHPNWRLAESNIRYDARQALAGWQSASYDDSAWSQAVEQGTPPTAPWNQLVARPIPPFRDSGLLDYANASELPAVSDGKPLRCRLPYNAQITPYFQVDAPAAQLIDLRTDNYRGGSEPNVRAEYVTRDGEQEYESLGWMNGHEVIYTIPAGTKIKALKYRETGYDTELVGTFECDDARLNTLWQKAQRTLYLEMRDNYFDCPGRERAQWWGDVTICLQQAFYALDRRSDNLARKGILELAAWQKPDGALFSPIPAGNWDKELPMQMLASVGRFGFWEYYQQSGDAETIREVYPAAKRYLELWKLNDQGLVTQRAGGWTWGDWGERKDMPLLFNGWYYLALDGLQKMASLVDDQEVVADCRRQRTELANAFNGKFWNGTEYRSPGFDGPPDDRGQGLAVVAGLAAVENYNAIASILNEVQQASPYMEKYVEEALFVMGRTDQALQRMRSRYGAMIDSPVSTLWEGWGIGPQGFGGGSYNHAWSGGPLTLLSQYVAGIRPLEPGYERFLVAPQLGNLSWVTASMESPRGKIEVRFRREQSRLDAMVVVPPDSVAQLRLPYRPNQRLFVRDAKDPSAFNEADQTTGITIEQIGDETATITLSSGEHRLQLKQP